MSQVGGRIAEMRVTRDLGIEIQGGRTVVLIPSGVPVPADRSLPFTTVADGQKAVEIRVVRCHSQVRVGALIGRFLLCGFRPGPRGSARIEIGLSIRRTGILRAWARDADTGATEEACFPASDALDKHSRAVALAEMVERLEGALSGPLHARCVAGCMGTDGAGVLVLAASDPDHGVRQIARRAARARPSCAALPFTVLHEVLRSRRSCGFSSHHAEVRRS